MRDRERMIEDLKKFNKSLPDTLVRRKEQINGIIWLLSHKTGKKNKGLSVLLLTEFDPLKEVKKKYGVK